MAKVISIFLAAGVVAWAEVQGRACGGSACSATDEDTSMLQFNLLQHRMNYHSEQVQQRDEAPFIRTLYLDYVEGNPDSHFAYGESIGRAMGETIREIWKTDIQLRTLRKWTSSGEGARIYQGFVDSSAEAFPLYTKEIEGMAAGARLPVKDFLLNNLRGELVQFIWDLLEAAAKNPEHEDPASLLADGSRLGQGDMWRPHSKRSLSLAGQRDGHCTDAFVVDHAKNLTAWGHNDDWDVNWRAAAYFIVTTVKNEENSSRFKFGTWVYPGWLPGCQMNWNSHGVVWTVNSLYPQGFLDHGVGYAWISRHAVFAASVEDLIVRISDSRMSTGLNYNIGKLGETSLWNVEVDVGGVNGVVKVDSLYVHTNRYKVLNVSEYLEESSVQREARWDRRRPGTIEELRGYLSDGEGQFPVYRDSTPEDPGTYTLVTGIVDIRKRRLSAWSTRSAGSPPLMEFSLDFPSTEDRPGPGMLISTLGGEQWTPLYTM